MSSKIKYTDIGHSKPNDVLWILIDHDMFTLTAGQSRTHELIWGGEARIDDCWKGRYELGTGYCSITPPEKQMGRRRPPDEILSLLRSRFSIVRFYFFTDGVDSFSPNPPRIKRR